MWRLDSRCVSDSGILKSGKAIRDLVQPDAPAYAAGILNLVALHGHCNDVKACLEELGLGSKVQNELDIAYGMIDRALERERQTAGVRHGQRTQRPVLNTSDLDDFEDL